MDERYKGKRFAGFLIVVLLVTAGYFLGDGDNFSNFATTLGLLFGAYVGGQSATDWKQAEK